MYPQPQNPQPSEPVQLWKVAIVVLLGLFALAITFGESLVTMARSM